MPDVTFPAGLAMIVVFLVALVLAGLFYLGDRREGPPNGSDRGR
ncbi:hypothetical protein [Actinomadura hibisca]|nr:hypothetical protein [Actinomadura hibisca]